MNFELQIDVVIDFFVKRQFVNCFKVEDFHSIVIMLKQAFFQFINNSKNFLIFDEKLFVIFCDDCDDIVDHNDAKISIV